MVFRLIRTEPGIAVPAAAGSLCEIKCEVSPPFSLSLSIRARPVFFRCDARRTIPGASQSSKR